MFFHFAEKQQHEEGAKRKRGQTKSVCPFNKASALQQMRDEVLGAVSDIEQLLKLGRETHSCPYYATRRAIPPAQVTQVLFVSHYCTGWFGCVCGFQLVSLFCLSGLSFTCVWVVFHICVVGGATLPNGASWSHTEGSGGSAEGTGTIVIFLNLFLFSFYWAFPTISMKIRDKSLKCLKSPSCFKHKPEEMKARLSCFWDWMFFYTISIVNIDLACNWPLKTYV